MRKKSRILRILLLFTWILVLSAGCEQESVNGPGEATGSSTTSNNLRILTFKEQSSSLNKLLNYTEWVTVQQGGYLSLEYDSPMNQYGNSLFVVSEESPYNIYKVDPDNPEYPEVAGQLAFKTGAIAMHPTNGLIYYIAKDKVNDIYRVAAWNPQTNLNIILLQGSQIKPAHKLAFSPDGTLYGVNNDERDELIEINTGTGAASIVRRYESKLEEKGDLAFGPDGVFYNLNDNDHRLDIIDLNSSLLSTHAELHVDHLTGLGFNRLGDLYVIKDNGDFFRIDLNSGQETYLGDTGINKTYDMTSFVGDVELAYSFISLEILPGSIDQDKDISLNMETTELSGGVAVIFEPHGTVFNPSALLNLTAYGVDFSGIDPAAVDIYYDNPETGQWELMPRESITVNAATGYLQVVNAQLPHFSRYAIGLE